MLGLAYGLGGNHRAARDGAAHLLANQRKGLHVSQSALLIGGMLALLGLCGLNLAQAARLGGLLQRGAGADERAAPAALLRRLGARRLGPLDAPPLFPLLVEIARRAGLPCTPELYCIPAATPNAFALGTPDGAVVAVTEGLLRHLTLDELAGILAHEVAHIRNSDTATMAMAQGLTTATELMALIGLMLLRLDTPGRAPRAPEAGLLLCLAPAISRLMQLALSRLRELDADLDAIALSGSAFGLMRALQKLEHHHVGGAPGAVDSLDGLLRSHPATAARLRGLFEVGIASHPALA
jgi:heat shock protein HtpX